MPTTSESEAPDGLGQSVATQMNAPARIAVDARGVLYVADAQNNAIRLIHAAGLANFWVCGRRSSLATVHALGVRLDPVSVTRVNAGQSRTVEHAAGDSYEDFIVNLPHQNIAGTSE